MNIDKAIEILTFHSKDFILEQDPDLINALKLGNEALKRVEHIRETYQKSSYVLLPGETES